MREVPLAFLMFTQVPKNGIDLLFDRGIFIQLQSMKQMKSVTDGLIGAQRSPTGVV